MNKSQSSSRRSNIFGRRRANTLSPLGRRARPLWDFLEDRTLMAGLPTISITDATIQEGSGAGPTVLSGAISPGTAIVGYRIDGVAGERLKFHTDNISSTAGTWSLYGPDNHGVAQAAFGTDFQADLTTDGYYDLFLAGDNTNPATPITYQIVVSDVSDSPVAPAGLNTPQSGTLPAGGSATFKFTASAGQRIEFDSQSTAAVTYTITDPTSHPVFNTYANNDLMAALTASGTYTVTATGAAGAAYAFNVLPLPAAATALTLGASTPGTVAPYSDVVYSFLGTPGQRLSFLENPVSTNPTNVYTKLYAPDGTQVFNVFDGPTAYVAPLTLTQPGRYYVVVDSEQATPSPYAFQLSDAATMPLTTNTTITDTYTNGRSFNLYSFSGTAGQRLYVNPLTQSPANSTGYAVFKPDNTNIIGYVNASPGYDGAVTLDETGTYLFLDYGADPSFATASDTIHVYLSPTPSESLTLSKVVTGNIPQPGAQHQYTFTGATGQTLFYDGLASDPNLSVSLSDPHGSNVYLGGQSAGSDYGEIKLALPGTYTLTVYGNGTATGNYSFNLRDITSAAPAAVNAPISGTLATGLSTDLYSFTATAGQQLGVQGLVDSHANGAYYYLYGPDNRVYLQNYTDPGTNSVYSQPLPYSGTYTLAVTGQSALNPTDAYSLNVGLTTTPPPDALTLGTPASGNIPAIGAQHKYTFPGTAGHLLFYDGRGPTTSTLYESIYDPNGNLISGNGGSSSDSGPYTLTTTGTYTLVISSGAYGPGTGTYNFDLYDFNSPTPPPSPLVLNATTSGTLASGLADDVYTFHAAAGHRLFIQGLTDAHSYEAYYTLYGPNGESLNSGYTDPGYNLTVAPLARDGTYTLVVQGQSDTYLSDAYSLAVFDNGPQATKGLILDATTTGTIAQPGAQDVYTFGGTAGQAVDFNGLASTPGFYATLTEPGGGNYYLNTTTINNGQYFPIVLPQTGTYTLTVNGGGQSTTGNYAFALRTFANASPINPSAAGGATAAGTLATGITTDLYSFTGTAGDRVSLQGLSGQHANGAYYYLYEADNSTNLTSNYTDLNTYSAVTLPRTGTYVLLVVGQNPANTSDSYGLKLTETPFPSETLALNTPTPGTIAQPGAQHNYTFTGAVGQTLLLDGLTGATGLAALLYDPSGTNVFIGGQGIDSDVGPFTLTRAGTYTLTVYGNGPATGGYNFELLDASTHTFALPSSGVSGTLNPGTQAAIYQFAGTAGQQVTFHTTALASSAGTWYLYDPDNGYVTGTGLGNDLTATLAKNGNYHLVLEGNAAPSNAYTFNATVVNPAVVAPTNLNVVQSGTLAANTSTAAGTYTFNATAGQVVYFDNQSPSPSLQYFLTDPVTNAVFSYGGSGDAGPYILTRSGTYNLKVTNTASSAQNFAFDLIGLPAGAGTLALGSNTSGTLAASAATFLQFSGTAGQTLFFNGQLASSAVNAFLYTPNLVTVFGVNSQSDSGPYVLPATGTYYLLLNNTSNTAASGYQFRLSDPSATSLTPNAVTSGTLSPGQAIDYYTFSGNAGQQVAVEPVSEAVSYGATYTLYNPSYGGITSGYLENGYSRTLTLPATGTYTLAVAGQQSATANAYKIEVFQSTPPAALALTPGTPVTGTIAQPGALQAYTFSGTAGHAFLFDGRGPAGTNLGATLTDPFGNVVNPLSNHDTTTDTSPFALSTTGTYTLTVSSSTNTAGTGTYNFDLYDFNSPTPPPSPLVLNATTSGTLASGLADDVYTFHAAAGHRLFIQGLTDAHSYEAYYTLYGPNGESLNSGYTEPGYNVNVAPLARDGTYTLVIQGQSDTYPSDAYSLAVFDNGPQASKALILDATTTGTIAQPGARDVYSFSGTGGQAVDFNGLTSTPGLIVTLTNPAGANFYLGGNEINNGQYYPIVLPQTGTYTLTVSGNNQIVTGNYAFALRTFANAKALVTNAPAGGTLATGITTDLYSFNATAGQKLDLRGLADGHPNAAYIQVYRPDFQNIVSTYPDPNYNAESPVLTQTGTYYAVVTGQNPANTNDTYQFEVFQSPPATDPLVLDKPTTGNIALPGALHTYTFAGTVGQTVLFDGLGDGAGNLATSGLNATLTDPFGNNVSLSPNGGNLNASSYPFALPSTGTYTLTVAGAGATGAYAFAVKNVASATGLAPNSPTTGTLASGLADDVYTFAASAGQQVYIQGLSDGHASSAYYELFSPDNQGPILSGYTENIPGNAFNTLPTTGTYTLVVYGTKAASTTNSYGVEVWLSTPQTKALVLNAPTPGTIQRPGDYQVYTFTGTPGQRLVIDGQSTPGGTVYASLYGPDPGGTSPGNYVAQGNLNGDAFITPALSQPGTYKLVLSSSDNTTGNYSFQVMDGATLTKASVNGVEVDVPVTLSAPSPTDVTVQYDTADDSATSPEDYRPAHGVLTIPAGQTTATIPVQIVNDADASSLANEDFFVKLSVPSANATLVRNQATVTIQEGPLVTLNDTSVTAPLNGTTTVTFLASLSSPSPNPVTVQYVTVDGSAKSPGDYQGVSTPTTVTFPAGVTSEPITVTVKGSNAGGPDKTFSVVLASPAYSLLGAKATGVATIHYQAATGSVTGVVFNDPDDDGILNNGEGGLSGWTVQLLNGSTVAYSTTSGSDGTFTFANVTPGTYTLAEVLKGVYTQTAPGSPGTFSVTVAAGGTSSGYQFGDILPVLTGISLSPTNPTVPKGLNQQFFATGVYTDHINRDLTGQVAWTSSNTAAATINASGTASTLATGTTTIAAALGGFTGSTVLTVSPAALTSLAISPSNPSVAKGLTQQFTATGTYTDGTSAPLTSQVTWASSNTSVATVSNAAGSQGLAQALFQGATTITAALGGVSNATTLTVNPPAVQSIAVTPANPSLAKGLSQQFTATATYTDSSTSDVSTLVTWASSNTGVATISNTAGSKGLASALTTGTSTITATLGSTSGTTVLTVSPAALTSLAISPSNPSVAKGLTQQFTATGTYTDGTSAPLTNQVTWASSNTSVATVSNAAGSQGLAQALFQGATTITAALGGVSNATTLTVNPPAVQSIAVTPANPSLAKGLSQQFTATATYTDSSTGVITNQVTWASSNTGVATISNTAGSQGFALAVGTGTSSITATAGGLTGSATITVAAPALQSIAVTPANPSVTKGATTQFTATGTYTDGSTAALTNQVTWASATPSVATVSNAAGSQGLATALAVGNTAVTATFGGQTGSTTLFVTAATLQSIAVTPVNPTAAKGTTVQFAATGTYSDSSTANLSGQVTWASSNTGVATVSNAAGSQGLAQALFQGATTITAALGGVSNATTLTVNPPAVQSIAVTPANPSLAKGLSQQFTATATYTDSSTSDVSTLVTWASSNTGVATISNTAGSQGLATAVGTGTTSITAALGGVNTAVTLTVGNAALVSVGVSPAIVTAPKGTTQQFTATGTYTDGTSAPLTNQVTWASSNTGVATISNTAGSQGFALAVGTGTSSITATAGGLTGSATITVAAPALQSIAVTPANPSVTKGATTQFTATGTYTDGSTAALTNQVTWASATPSVATVSNAAGSQGLATALAVGNTAVTATFGGQTGSTTLFVTAATLQSIAVTPVNPTAAKGTTVQFAATGTYSDSSTANLSGQVTWASSNTGVATVSNAAGSQGLASTIAPGSTSITAALGGFTGTATLTVANAALVSISVNPAVVSIPKGTAQQFTAKGTYSDGSSADLTSQVTWASATPSVATIGASTGLATALAQGSTAITAALNGVVSPAATLTVGAAQLVSIAVTPASPTIGRGATQQFTATGTYTDGTSAPLTSQVTWTSGTPSVATIGAATGLATGVGLGTTSITATSGGITSAPDTLTVVLPVLSPVAVKDNGQAGYYEYGVWSDAAGGFNGSERVAGPGTASTSARWVLQVPAGVYDVYASWVGSASNTSAAPYLVKDGFTTVGSFTANQKLAPADAQYGGVQWAKIGTVTVTKGTVLIGLTASGVGNTAADGVLLAPAGAVPSSIRAAGVSPISATTSNGPALAAHDEGLATLQPAPAAVAEDTISQVALDQVTKKRKS